MAKYYVSLCLIIRDDHDYIEEWINYHRSVGVKHFYITDNKSQPPLESKLINYIKAGLVTYNYDTRDHPQLNVYNECIHKHRHNSTWIGFLDSDEFLVLKKHRQLKDFLKEYEPFGAVSIAWKLFGSNGHRAKQSSILRSYTTRLPDGDQCHYKTIVQPLRVVQYVIHHVATHVPGYYTVDEQKRMVSGPYPNQVGASFELCQINHYVLRSYQDYLDKQKRGGGDTQTSKTWHFFFHVNLKCIIEDQQILQPNTPCRRLPEPPPIPCDPPDFNWTSYLINNPDVSATECTQKWALLHWYYHGRNENRQYRSSVNFNWKNYVNRYSDLRHLTTEESALRHYINHGIAENRNPS